MRLSIVTRCDVGFSLNSAYSDWSSDYHIARKLAEMGHSISFYSWHQERLIDSQRGIKHFNTQGNNISKIAGMIDRDSDVVLVSSWKSLVRELRLSDINKNIILWVRANKDMSTNNLHEVNEGVKYIIAVSGSLRDALVAKGYSKEKIEVVGNGYDPNIFFPFFGKREKMLVYAGAVVPEKGIDLLLNAFNLVHSAHQDLELHLYGSASLYGWDPIYKFEDKSNMPRRVIFHGISRQGDLAIAFRKAELGFLLTDPDAGFETFGKSALEMQVCGLPIVVSNNGALPERVIDGKTGYVLDDYSPDKLAEAILKYYSLSAKKRMEMSRNAYLSSKENTWEKSAQELDKLLQRLT